VNHLNNNRRSRELETESPGQEMIYKDGKKFRWRENKHRRKKIGPSSKIRLII